MHETYFSYWAKTGENDSYHLLPYHCLDVAAVATAWWSASISIRRSFCREADQDQIAAWVRFFCALHDYGKFDVRFQRKHIPSWHSLYPLKTGTMPSKQDSINYRHGEAGLFWFYKDIQYLFGREDSGSLFLDDLDPDHWPSWKRWIEAVTGHHGHIKNADYVASAKLPSYIDPHLRDIDRTSRVAWFETLTNFFLKPAGLSLISEPPDPSPLLAGFCSVSDWLASRHDGFHFSYHCAPQDLKMYFEDKVEGDARWILGLSGIIGRPRAFGGIEKLIPENQAAHPLQQMACDLPLEPGLTIIEAPTGTGKTEAALAYAWRLIEIGLADSIVFALPTQATANAMFSRLERLAAKLFSDGPNLLLAHGHARFNKEFAALKIKCAPDCSEEEDGWVKCNEWLHESRKRVFLGQIGVCTIDQVLISVLPVKHNFVRSFGIGRSVLIVDEVHAYDAYMYQLLEQVLSEQRRSGGSSILLSATLPAGHKQQLFCSRESDPTTTMEHPPYPLITFSNGERIIPFQLHEKHAQAKSFAVNIECMYTPEMTPDTNLIQRIINAAEDGAQVAIVCNLVDVAQQLYEKIIESTQVHVDLFHSRFRFKDRSEKETNVIKNFGPSGDRSKGRILIATQVVEQSLDVDFDWLITQLCPVDLLFQRLGRLHRHRRDRRPLGFQERLCTVLLSQDGDYGPTAFVYTNFRVLWRTKCKLMAATDGKIIFPEAYRDWIEAVYREDPWPNEPQEIMEMHSRFEEELFQSRCRARQQIESAVNPFADCDAIVSIMTRDSEMSLTVVPCWNSSTGKRLLDCERLDVLDEYQLRELLAMNSINVPGKWRSYFDPSAQMDEGGYWLEMQPDGKGFITQTKKIIFKYHRDTGLRRENV